MTEPVYVVDLDELDATQFEVGGGKGAQLGELARVAGVVVPPGVCVTTAAQRRAAGDVPEYDRLLDGLAGPTAEEALDAGAELRRAIESTPVPADVADAIRTALASFDPDTQWAVRSSATAEDLPHASFAGQHDTFLGVVGAEAVIAEVRRCWASLFSDRAVTYRRHHGVDHRGVEMAVVVQRMLAPDVSGVLFTADPVTSDRRVSAVEATAGLGDALVAGHVDPERYRVRDRVVVERARSETPLLRDAQLVALDALGRRIEARFGRPVDVEWCLVGEEVHVVQARPITTLFPVPATDHPGTRVYVSVGHQQMMTDPMTPLGLSIWQMTALRPMYEAGSRLFVDVTDALASPVARAGLVEGLGRSDPLIGSALRTLVDRLDAAESTPAGPPPAPPSPAPPIETDAAIVAELVARADRSTAAAAIALDTTAGLAVFDTIREDLGRLRDLLAEPRSLQVIGAAIDATRWLDDHLSEWLGERGIADEISRWAPGNVSSEMGLDLLDVADAARSHPEALAVLREGGDGLLQRLAEVDGGRAVLAAIDAYLDRYGMRGPGEIDVGRPRWSDRPDLLARLVIANVDALEPANRSRLVEEGRRRVDTLERDILDRVRALPDGEHRAEETARMIQRVRTFIGYREHPKHVMATRYHLYRRALLRAADALVDAGALSHREDAVFLRFDELEAAVHSGAADRGLVDERRRAFRGHHALTPPRVMTSDGEVVTGSYDRDDAPAGALIGLAVSAGTVEGRARVIAGPEAVDLQPGDILVTTATDPSWSPLFLAVAGLVTEVGGWMTHGAVVAREYGLPAVVGVEHATRLIEDGQRIRLDGTLGLVEVL